MIAFDPKLGVPSVWSLAPRDTLALVFWTKDPSKLIASQLRLQPYNVIVHMTATGWREVEPGAPTLEESGRLLVEACRAFSRVHWRFSPIPLVPDQLVLERFKRLLEYAVRAGRPEVFVSFLQPNDMLPETRSATARFDLLNRLAEEANPAGLQVLLCKDDRTLDDWQGAQYGLAPCVPVSDFGAQGLPMEACECVIMVDPFTINESCSYGCQYCYAGDKTLAVRKRNSIRGLPVVR
jgi:DNA repair photolyase